MVSTIFMPGVDRKNNWKARAKATVQKPKSPQLLTDESRAILRRWYEDMYAQGRYLELAPQLCGPVFVRHEGTGTFSATAEEHAARLQKGTGGSGRLFHYRVFAEGDKVGVIGLSPNGWVQAWRVAGGKLVESWWVGARIAGAAW